MSSIEVGTHAPHLNLVDSDKKPVTVPEHGAVTVLAFFPAAFTGVCTTEMCTLRDQLADYEKLAARVYGVSVDSPFALAEFRKQQGIGFALLSDHRKEAIRAYDIVFPNLAGIGYETAKRSVFVVGRDGNVAWRWIADAPAQQPDYAAIQAAVARAAE